MELQKDRTTDNWRCEGIGWLKRWAAFEKKTINSFLIFFPLKEKILCFKDSNNTEVGIYKRKQESKKKRKKKENKNST